MELLRDLQSRHQLAYLFISHDMNVVRAVATRLLVMKDGKVIESGLASQIFERPRCEYTRELIAAALLRESANGADS